MIKIKVKIEGGEDSAGRGVGFYRNNLVSALGELDGVEVVVENSDLVHYTFFDLFYHTLPNSSDVPTVVTIHDLTPLVLPEYYPMGIRAKLNFDRQKMALKNVSAIITDSNNSKKDIVDILKIKPEKVFVTYLAVDNAYSKTPTDKTLIEVREKYHLPKKFILYVGGINANKNLVRLAKAAIKLNVHLVFVGSEFVKYPVETFSLKKLLGIQKVHPEIKQFEKLQQLAAGNPLFHFLGFVSAGELNTIYHLASLYCQPSLYEGFGLPLLEAMTAECPIISSNSGSLPEIYPEGTINFDPEDQSEIESALKKGLNLNKKDRENLIKAGKEKASGFSWKKTAQETYNIYLSILTG
jgi:glycosyltransferase involved in cell wall biosynthesis